MGGGPEDCKIVPQSLLAPMFHNFDLVKKDANAAKGFDDEVQLLYSSSNSGSKCSNLTSQCLAGRAYRRGLVLVCSQKTLSVAALILPQVAEQLKIQLGASGGGIAMVVCVFVYIVQLAIDFLIGSEWSKQLSQT